jgi:hypothetical protein
MLAEYGLGIVPVYAALGAVCTAGLAAGAQYLVGGPATLWWAVSGVVLAGVTFWRKMAAAAVRRRYSGSYIDHSMLDEHSRIMLLHAQSAADTILATGSMGLLHAGDEALLRESEWRIGCSLLELSRLYDNSTPGAGTSTLLAVAGESVTGHVLAVIRCAQEAESAAGAWRDWCPEYLDLASRVGADEHITGELDDLAGRLRLSSLG